jgi:hypothetical protein
MLFRLGACEAPPCVVTTHLGDDMTCYLEAYISKLARCVCCLGFRCCWLRARRAV